VSHPETDTEWADYWQRLNRRPVTSRGWPEAKPKGDEPRRPRGNSPAFLDLSEDER
jgi:hypothetical protein